MGDEGRTLQAVNCDLSPHDTAWLVNALRGIDRRGASQLVHALDFLTPTWT